MRILWVKAGKLLPVDTGGKIRSYNILKQLARDHEVTLISYYSGQSDAAYEMEIQRELPGTQAICIGRAENHAAGKLLRYAAHLIDPAPFAVSKFSHGRVRRRVAACLNSTQFDVAVCDFLSATLSFPESSRTPSVLFQHNVESILWQRMASNEANPAKRLVYRVEAYKMSRYERKSLSRFDRIVAVSENDRRQMMSMNPRCTVSVIPTGVDTQKFALAPSSSANPPRILFLGSMDWEPNIDAVNYFVREIFPPIRADFPSSVLQIVGRNPQRSVKQLASDSVIVTGTVPSVYEYLRDATVVVVPLRIGGGTRLKIYEAMAMGKAVVSTSIGAEGLEVTEGRDLILADDASSFASAVTLLLRDSALRHKLEQSAAILAAQFDWSNIARRFAEILREASSRAAAAARRNGSRVDAPQ